jgi:UTP-glucose-1-phosphate uridylyltransferase
MAPKSKLLLIYLAILALLILAACNPLRKAERLVLNNRDASNRVFNTLALERPCANDTMIVTLSDTTILQDTIFDYKRDTINNVITLTEKGKTIVKTIKVVDIKTAYVQDMRMVAILSDSVRFYKVLYQTEHKYKKQAESRFWWLIIAIVGIFILKRYVWSFLNTLP